jgi:hypothetical protein
MDLIYNDVDAIVNVIESLMEIKMFNNTPNKRSCHHPNINFNLLRYKNNVIPHCNGLMVGIIMRTYPNSK